MVGQYDRADDILVNHGNGIGTCVTSGIEMTLRLAETMRRWSCHYTDVLPLSPLPRSTYGVRSMCPKIIAFKVAAPPKAHSSDQEPIGRSQCTRRGWTDPVLPQTRSSQSTNQHGSQSSRSQVLGDALRESAP